MEKPFIELKDGDPFITLEQFLLLPEYSCWDHHRLWGTHMDGPEWVLRYKLAKEMWEKYGNNPPMGIDVRVLVNGHACDMIYLNGDPKRINSAPIRQLFAYDKPEAPWYYLIREKTRYTNKGQSLLDKYFWWRSIYIPNG